MQSTGPSNPYVDNPRTTGLPPVNPWSKAAVVGFGASFSGCTVVGALIGLVLGIVGILKTGDGTRRGRGLAIAAIPISLLTGLMGGYAAFGTYAYFKMSNIANKIPAAVNGGDVTTAANQIRELASAEFKEQVPVGDVERWVTSVRETHGKFVSMVPDPSDAAGPTQSGMVYLNYEGKFVSGDASVRIFFSAQSILGDPHIVNIEIDGKAIRVFDEAP